jgi:hypothetical protein
MISAALAQVKHVDGEGAAGFGAARDPRHDAVGSAALAGASNEDLQLEHGTSKDGVLP